jgi:ADP-ribose pyrophosphatase
VADFKVVFSKRVRRTAIFDVVHERAVGPHGIALDREILKHPGAVTVVPRNDRGEVLLVHQFRLPVRRSLWELPAGKLDKGEKPRAAAKRELAEETGLRARRWKKLLEFYPSPGFCDERMTAYLAEGLTEGDAAPEPYELIRTKWFSRSEALEMVRRGIIRDSKTVTTLLYLDKFQSRSD